jgi:hypothetical protein
MEEQPTESEYEILAERLCAAYISTQMGLGSVDYVIKRYVRGTGEPPSEVWFQIAAFVGEVMMRAKPQPPDSARAGQEGPSALAAPTTHKRGRRKERLKEK